eukprot:1159098-Pelagomonas_calceolata.AAC.8
MSKGSAMCIRNEQGLCNGVLRGMRKEGLGVYTYLSGARYEGEWRDNLKDGRGALCGCFSTAYRHITVSIVLPTTL